MHNRDGIGKYVRLNTVVVRFDRFGGSDSETAVGLVQDIVEADWWKGCSRKPAAVAGIA
jgi:hypothetical protein